jgi:hypothetical protein
MAERGTGTSEIAFAPLAPNVCCIYVRKTRRGRGSFSLSRTKNFSNDDFEGGRGGLVGWKLAGEDEWRTFGGESFSDAHSRRTQLSHFASFYPSSLRPRCTYSQLTAARRFARHPHKSLAASGRAQLTWKKFSTLRSTQTQRSSHPRKLEHEATSNKGEKASPRRETLLHPCVCKRKSLRR